MTHAGSTGRPEQGDVGELIRTRLHEVADFPQPGVLFRDMSPLLADAAAFGASVDALAALSGDADLIAGIEARGFLLAGAVACRLERGLVPVRKAGKLPPPTVRARYDLEYGSAEIEVPTGILDGQRVFLVDDVLATGGTLRASADLLGRAGATVSAIGVLVELTALEGRAVLTGLPEVRALLRL